MRHNPCLGRGPERKYSWVAHSQHTVRCWLTHRFISYFEGPPSRLRARRPFHLEQELLKSRTASIAKEATKAALGHQPDVCRDRGRGGGVVNEVVAVNALSEVGALLPLSYPFQATLPRCKGLESLDHE